MTLPHAEKNRLELRQAIGYNLGAILVSEVTDTKDTTSLWDTYGLAKGGDDEYNGRQVQINTPAGSIVAGEKSFVSDFASADKDATMSPAFTDVLTDGDTYEMWDGYTIEEVNEAINQAIRAATDDCIQDKETHNTVKEADIYEYTIPTGFVALHTVEYEYDTKIDNVLHNCDAVWDELVDGDVTASLDTDNEKDGTGCLKLVVAAGCAAGDILATEDITSLDISDCDEVTAWIWSSAALTAGDIQILLDNTAQCASAVESLDIPAVSANTWTRVVISLANPTSDSAIISIGLKMVVDKGAFTLRADDIRAYKADSIIWKPLPPDFWGIIQGTTNKLQLSQDGYSAVSNNTKLRLNGYQVPAELSDDSTDATVDPDFIEAHATGHLMAAHGGGRDIDPEDRERRSKFWLEKAEHRLVRGRTGLEFNTKWVS